MKKALIVSVLLLLSHVTVADEAQKEKKGKWTFGVGVLGASLPHYAGADQSKSLLLPFPYIHYKSEKLTIDRTGIVRNLWSSDSLELTLSGQGSVKVDSTDNNARSGMSDLGWVGATGPTLKWHWRQDKSLFMQLATRKAFAFDSGIENIGWVGETSLNWYSDKTAFSDQSTWHIVLIAKLKYADTKYNDYFYGVDNQFATANRAVYTATSGYSGSQLLAGLNVEGERYRAGVFVRYSNINGATFEDSPLVRQKNNGAFGFAFAWLFSSH